MGPSLLVEVTIIVKHALEDMKFGWVLFAGGSPIRAGLLGFGCVGVGTIRSIEADCVRL